MRPPLAPIGWPSATAPPFTLTRSSSAPSSSVECFATDENASLISTRATSSIVLPARASATAAAFAGRAREVGDLVGDVALREDRRERLDPAAARPLLARDDDARGAVVHTRRVAGGRRALRRRRPAGAPRASRATCRGAGSRRPRPRRPRRSPPRGARRRSRRPRAGATGTPTRPAPRARCRARARRTTPARPCAARRRSRRDRRG